MPTDGVRLAFSTAQPAAQQLRPLPGRCCVYCSYGTAPVRPLRDYGKELFMSIEPRAARDPPARLARAIARLWPTDHGDRRQWCAAFDDRRARSDLGRGLRDHGWRLPSQPFRCGRVHCYFTGPFLLAMSGASILYGAGVLPLGANGWKSAWPGPVWSGSAHDAPRMGLRASGMRRATRHRTAEQ